MYIQEVILLHYQYLPDTDKIVSHSRPGINYLTHPCGWVSFIALKGSVSRLISGNKVPLKENFQRN